LDGFFALADVEPLGSDPHCQIEVTRCNGIACCPLFPCYPGHIHAHTPSDWPSRGRPPANPAPASAASTRRPIEQADGTTISSLSPALSHHHTHSSSPRGCLHHDTSEGDHKPAIPTSAPPRLLGANSRGVTCCSVSGRSAAASVTHIPPETAPESTALSVLGSFPRDFGLFCSWDGGHGAATPLEEQPNLVMLASRGNDAVPPGPLSHWSHSTYVNAGIVFFFFLFFFSFFFLLSRHQTT
jgi:hypothetical protein